MVMVVGVLFGQWPPQAASLIWDKKTHQNTYTDVYLFISIHNTSKFSIKVILYATLNAALSAPLSQRHSPHATHCT